MLAWNYIATGGNPLEIWCQGEEKQQFTFRNYLDHNIMKPNRCSSSDLKYIFRNASNDLHVLNDYQLQNVSQLTW
jgi:hypothetical protein